MHERIISTISTSIAKTETTSVEGVHIGLHKNKDMFQQLPQSPVTLNDHIARKQISLILL